MRLSAIHMLAASAAPARAFVTSAASSMAGFAGGPAVVSGARPGAETYRIAESSTQLAARVRTIHTLLV